MAEINIERKKKPVWPWILLLVLVALIGWVVYEYMSDRNTAAAVVNPDTTALVVHNGAQSPQLFIAFV